jgi:hypothetical protein
VSPQADKFCPDTSLARLLVSDGTRDSNTLSGDIALSLALPVDSDIDHIRC